MWLVDPALPVVAAGLAAMVAWRQETRRLHRRALYEPWTAETSGEESKEGGRAGHALKGLLAG